jgi:hypothetical protein
MCPLHLFNLVVTRLFELLDVVSAVAAQALHRINNTAEISKQADLFLYDVSARRARDYTAAMILPSVLASHRETSPPSPVVPSSLSFVVVPYSYIRVEVCVGDGAR